MVSQNSSHHQTLINELSSFSTATIYEALGKVGAVHSSIKPLSPKFKICGPVFTVQGHPMDNLALHRAISEAQPEQIILATVGEYSEAGYWGEIMTIAAKERNIGGFVFDGAVRDSEIIKELEFPVFCNNICIKGTTKKLEGKLNYPIVFKGVHVKPGDVIHGDADGVIIIPIELLEDAVNLSNQRVLEESKIIEQLKTKTTLEVYNL